MVYSHNLQHMLIVFGPTGVGKTDFAQRVADTIPAEIVNMDVGQFYTPLTVGTAKPNLDNVKTPHHLFNVLDKPVDYSVVAYRSDIMRTVHDIWSRGALPILVGGSGFYLKSLLFPPTVPVVVSNSRLVTAQNVQEKWQELAHIDPVRAAVLDKNDVYRIGRALDIWFNTGIKPSDYTVMYDPPASFTLLFLTRDRSQLYDRINMRVDGMMHEGLLEEVKGLCNTQWEQFLLKKKLIGYNELLDYLQGQQTPEHLGQAIELIKQRSRHYAKRQLTFWRMVQSSLQKEDVALQMHNNKCSMDEVNLTLLNADLYIKLIVDRIVALYKK